jgi:O-antigen ligase/tetratricopeptide (TPR) repeat protein
MPRTPSLVRFINGMLEMGWLFILVGVPIFFNVRDYRVFEPDKIVLLRNVVLFMAVLFLIKAVYLAPLYVARWSDTSESPETRTFAVALTTALKRRPIVIAAFVFAFIYVIASIHSILPTISFWGSYDRMEGAYTYLSYITLFLIVQSHLRTWRQLERLVTAIIFASVPVAAYSWLQHFNADPLIWASNGQTTQRTPSTMGNPIFLAAYLLMTVPFTLHRLTQQTLQLLKMPAGQTTSTDQLWAAISVVGYVAALGLQLGAIGFSGSRGPALGLLAALIVFGLAVAIRRRITWLLRSTAVVAVLLVLVFGATNTVFKSGDTPGSGWTRFLHLLPSESGSSEVRSLLWKSSLSLVKEHPILGCGPEDLIFCWYPHYPAELRQVELANAAPDRSHDEEIDIILTSGILGEIAYLALLGISAWIFMRLVRRSTSLASVTFSAALLAAFLGHIVEGVTGIAFSATLMMLWIVMAIGTALDAGNAGDAAASYSGIVAADSTETPDNQDRERVSSARPKAADSSSSKSSRRVRDQRQRDQQSRQTARRGVERGAQYSAGATLSRLSGLSTALIAIFAVMVIALSGVAVALGISNIQLIQADADYRLAQNYEIAAGQLVGQSGQLQQTMLTYQAAIASYQDALNTVPSWIDPPPQDTYYLFLGKTLLEYADALRKDTTGTVTTQQVTGVLQQALQVFQQAAKANPLNPDHPRNIAKLYNFWGSTVFRTTDVSKLVLADGYFAQASALAPHNSDILDEWAVLDMSIGNFDAKQAKQRYDEALNHLQAAQALFPESGAVYRDLGTAYARYSQFASDAKQPPEALRYARLQEQAWITALKYAAPQYQQIYPRLAQLYFTTLHNPCSAGTYAALAIQEIHTGSLADPDGSLAPALQNMVTAATQHGCPATAP